MTKHDQPICPYCTVPARLTLGGEVYPNRPELFGKRLWICDSCGAYVGCHDGTTKPLGRLANAELRAAKSRAHAAFDPLWQAKMRQTNCSKWEARGAGYRWLSQQLGIKKELCHIGMFDVATCERVVEICSRYRGRAAA
jgi:hypothetical protein